MVEKVFESERLLFKPFSSLTSKEKGIIIQSWSNPFNARYNSTKDAKKSVLNISKLTEPTFKDLNNFYDCMYYRAVFDKSTNQIIGTCRFGKYYRTSNNDCWDFGFNVLLKHWYKGYGTEILGKVVKIARQDGIKSFIGSADAENIGSYKAMIKNGFAYDGIDADGDFVYKLDLAKAENKKDNINQNWNDYIAKLKQKLGLQMFEKLENINIKIKEIVKQIQNGEDENQLANEYYKQLFQEWL